MAHMKPAPLRSSLESPTWKGVLLDPIKVMPKYLGSQKPFYRHASVGPNQHGMGPAQSHSTYILPLDQAQNSKRTLEEYSLNLANHQLILMRKVPC